MPEENHELALVLLALVAREHGWRTTVLGINVPVRELEREALAERVDMVALAKAYRGASGVPYVRAVRKLKALQTIPLAIGGGGWTQRDRERMEKLTKTHLVSSFDELRAHLEGYALARKERRVYA